MKRSSPGLRARLMQLVLLAVVPAFGVIVYTAISQREHTVEDFQRDAGVAVRQAVREQRRLIRETRVLLLGLARSPAVREMSGAACAQTMEQASRDYPYYTNIGVATPAGIVSCNSRPLARRISLAGDDYFRRAVRSRNFAIGEYRTGQFTGEPAIAFGHPILDPDGRVRGVVFAALGLGWIESLIDGALFQPGSVLLVIDEAGVVLARHPEPEKSAGPGPSISDASRIKSLLADRREGVAEMAIADDVRRLYAFGILHESAGAKVYVLAGVPRAAAYVEANRQFVFNLALLIITAALVLIAAWIGSRVLVLRRMNMLADAARRLGKGDLSARTGLQHGDDEFGRLARSFDDMASTLQRVNRALKTLSAGNRAMVRATDEQALLSDMCRVIVEVGGYQMAWIGFAEHDELKTVRPVAEFGFAGGLPALAKMVSGINWAEREGGRGAFGTAIRTGKTSVQHDFATNPNLAPWGAQAVQRGYGSVAAFPLLIDGKPIGALGIYAPEIDAFGADELDVLDEAATDLAFGIASLRTRADSERAQATIQHLAKFDRLTGLPNHASFQDQLQQSLRHVDSRSQTTAVVMVGLNRLRQINEALGFQHGDLLLQEVGTRLRAAVGEDILVARMRGDEFALMAIDPDRAQAESVARHALDSLAAPFAIGGLQLDVSAAAGIALSPEHGTDPLLLLRCADVAMQQAKKTNKDTVFYSSEQDAHSARRLSLAGELRSAIENGELSLHYQAKIDIPSGEVCGAEALVRWMHPTRGMIRPDEFINVAEQTGLIKPLTDWVMAHALRQSAEWRRSGVAVPIAINLSARNLHDATMVKKVETLLAEVRADVDWLEIEITEGAMMEDPETALKALARLNEMGIKLFIDDFGTGYSSLGYLKKLPVDAVKIDKSFVIDMLTSSDSAAIVRSTIDLAHDLDLKVVAEGVENQAMLERLSVLGCDVAQGYHFCKPLPAGQFKGWVEGRRRN